MIEKTILVCCGTGIATSVQVANKLQRLLRERGVNARMKHCRVAQVPKAVEEFAPDAIVSTTAVKQPHENVKMFRGVAFLTGVDEGRVADEIAAALKS
ncbi:PTS sugar transporter subunit IIB [Cutibacterium sp.]|uniref:PTS sugar transporter subunit IIB n=1 Tax=Cutibacterium sp. TaxID=1912221 RepID=UPI0026DDB8CD|nr:PTS sugar transporter subunit IIB [Cutibacterium sp.]MDO4412836.1 PTS sugar transporter subunit IIB [Cutibacterium sp.]